MADARTLGWNKRITALFERNGENFDLIRSGVTLPHVGLFVVGNIAVSASFYDDNEQVGLLRPALSVYLAGTEPDPPVSGDVFFRQTRLWTVRKTYTYQSGNTAMLILALCD